jgi:hypothetical protein
MQRRVEGRQCGKRLPEEDQVPFNGQRQGGQQVGVQQLIRGPSALQDLPGAEALASACGVQQGRKQHQQELLSGLGIGGLKSWGGIGRAGAHKLSKADLEQQLKMQNSLMRLARMACKSGADGSRL